MDLLPFLIAGLMTGGVYGLAGVGLVLTYKTSGILNFAQGALATLAAYAFYTLNVQHQVPWVWAAIVVVLVGAPFVGVLFERLAAVLASVSLTVQVVGTVGVLLITESVILLVYGTQVIRTVPQYLPTNSFGLFGAPVTAAALIVFGVSVVVTVLLNLYLRLTRSGVAMRAVVDNQELLDLAGTSPSRIRRKAWIIGVVFAALSGVLLAPALSELNADNLTLLVVTSFGAAAIGGFRSISRTYLGGIILGVASAFATKYFTTGFLAGLAPTIPFLVLFGYLVLAPKGSLRPITFGRNSTASSRQPRPFTQISAGVVVIGFLAAVPWLVGGHLDVWMQVLTYTMLFLSLGLLVRTSGQVSLCHVTFLAIGSAAFSHFAVNAHLPWLVAIVCAGLVAVPLGALLAIPAIRLSGLYLALATLGFGILVSQLFYSQGFMFGASGLGLTVPRPSLSWLSIQSDRGYYYVLLVAAILVAVVVVMLGRSRLGRLLQALSSSPTGLSATGVSVNVTRVVVFCISAFLAAIAGALNGGIVGIDSASNYDPLLSITLFVLVIITVGAAPWYALLAAAGLALVPGYLTNANVINYLTLIFGVAAVVYGVTRGGAGEGSRVWRRRKNLAEVASRPADIPAPSDAEPPFEGVEILQVVGDGVLALDGVHVEFGGLVAVEDVCLEVPMGRITGLIGPNGAGKTTTFNACTGLVSLRRGRVELDGRNLTHFGTAARARAGIGRTFQHFELFDNLTVWENVALGSEGGMAGGQPLRHLLATRKERRKISESASAAVALCSLSDLAGRPVSDLSTGQRRLVELARCLAGAPEVLLLDEPSSGLDPGETERFGQIIQLVVANRKIGVLLIEHDMSLVNAICEYVYVLDFGRMIVSGPTAEVMASSVVQQVYLGTPRTFPESELKVAVNGGGVSG